MKKNQLLPGMGKLSLQLRQSFLFCTLVFLSQGTFLNSASASGLLEFKIEDNNNVYWDRLLMAFDPLRSDLKENYDAAKMSNPEVNFYSYSSDNQKLSIDVRPFAHNKIIRLGLTTPYKKDYFIRIVQLNMPTGMQLQLKDKYLNTTVTLSVGAKYNFTVNNDSLSQGDNRFEFKCIDPNAVVAPLNASVTAGPQYTVTGQNAYTIYKGYGIQAITLFASPTGGVSPYTYSWTPTTGVAYPNAATTAVSPSVTTTYTVTVTDAANNTKTQSYTIYVIDAACDSGNVKVCNNGITQCLLPEAVSAFLADTPNHYLGACLSVDATVTNVSCNGGTNGAINVSLSGARPPYSFTWSNSATTQNLNGLEPGNYTIYVSSADGKTTSKTITVSEPAVLSVNAATTNVSCYGAANGQAQLSVTGGNGLYSYLWNDNDTSSYRTGLGTGNYSVIITDNKGCTAKDSFSITQPDALVASGNIVSQVTCNSGANGHIQINTTGGTAPYIYLWNDNNRTAARNDLAAGDYSVLVTDSNGCTAVDSFTITQPSAINVTSSLLTNVTCYGGANGQVQLSTAGGAGSYTYLWSDNATTITRNNLTAGNYLVTVTDASGCTAQKAFTITQPEEINVQVSVSPVYTVSGQSAYTIYKGYGPQSVTLSASVSGGVAGYNYSWSPSNNLSNRYAATTSATPGMTTNYTLTVTDSRGCTATGYQKIYVENVKCNGTKVQICHGGATQCVTTSQANTHIAHGDKLGDCNNKSGGVGEEEMVTMTDMMEEEIKVFPNPSTGVFNVLLPGSVKGGNVHVLDMNGKIVEKLSFLPDTKLSVDLGRLPKGVYMMQVMNGADAYRVRVVLIN